MTSRLIEFNLPGSGFRKGNKLYNVIKARYLDTNYCDEFDAQQLYLNPDEVVILEDPRGPVPAKVVSYSNRMMRPADSLMRVLRAATEQDLRQIEDNKRKEEDGYRFALKRIKARRLPMKLVRVQWIHDGSRIVFYYSSPNRVDFRELVKELAQRFHTRIELHQIGVRDGTSFIGGIGSCGLELCCSTFLKNFSTVSITLAKDQGITLKPQKISGQCGRLMCCLVYEHKVYLKNKRRLPRVGEVVTIEEGEAIITGVDVLNRNLYLRIEESGQRMKRSVDEVILSSQRNQVNEPEPVSETEYLWESEDIVTLID